MRSVNSKLIAALLLSLACMPWFPAHAEEAWPARPVRLLVPFPPGGAVDIVGRIVAEKLGQLLGQPVFVDNRPGVNGSLGADIVAHARPDGYTLMVSSIGSHALNPLVNRNVKYDAQRDFTHIALLARSANVLLAGPGFRGETVQDVIAHSKAHPRSLNVAITGYGSSGHMATELFSQAAGIDFNVVPYKGDASAIADLLAGQVDLLFDNYMAAAPQVRAGKLHALAVADTVRSALFPGVPTMEELGLDVVINPWMGIAGPANMPPALVERLNHALNRILEMPDVTRRLAGAGLLAMPGTAAGASAHIAAEIARWSGVAKAGGISVE